MKDNRIREMARNYASDKWLQTHVVVVISELLTDAYYQGCVDMYDEIQEEAEND